MVFSIGLGVPAGYALARFSFRGADAFRLMILLTRAFPLAILALPLTVIFIRLGLYDTPLGVGLVHTALALPFAALVTASLFSGIPRELEEAAWVFGCSRLKAFRRVVLPLALPGIAAAAIFAFVISWNEVFAASVLTVRHRTLTAYLLTRAAESPASLPLRRRLHPDRPVGGLHLRRAANTCSPCGASRSAERSDRWPASSSTASRKALRRRDGAERRQPRRRRWRVRRAARAVGLRQDHAAAHRRRPRDAERRTRADRRARRDGPHAARARARHGVPELRGLPAHDRPRQRRLRPAHAGKPPKVDRAPGREGGGAPAYRALSRPLSRRSSPAGSASASRSRVRSRSSRPCC